MTDANKPDWELAKALYIQGLPYRDIAEQCHATESALRKQVSRNKWRELQTRAVTIKSQVTKQDGKGMKKVPASESVQFGENKLKGSSQAVRRLIAEDLEGNAEVLAKLPRPRSIGRLRERLECAQIAANVGEKVFDWSGTQEYHFDLQLMSQPVITSRPPEPAIDAEIVPSLPTEGA